MNKGAYYSLVIKKINSEQDLNSALNGAGAQSFSCEDREWLALKWLRDHDYVEVESAEGKEHIEVTVE